MKTPLQKLREQYPDLVTDDMLRDELELLRHAFRAGWLRANAMNYDENYFEHFLFSEEIVNK